MTMSTRNFIVYLVSCSCLAILSALFLIHNNQKPSFSLLSSSSNSNRYGSGTDRIWPELEPSWKLVLATVIGFFGSACGTVGGVGGGGIFVPMLNLLLGFDTKSAAALSKCMIMGASASSVWYNLRVAHPTKQVPILDYDLALLFQPMLMLGITVGVTLSVVFPFWLITVLIIILFIGTSLRSFFKGIEMWRVETLLKKETAEQAALVNSNGEFKAVLVDTKFEPLIPKEQKSTMQILCFNLRWKRILVLLSIWFSFLLIQIIKTHVEDCSVWYWVLFGLQFPIAFLVFGFEAVKLYKDHRMRMGTGSLEYICEASIEWSATSLAFCAMSGIVGGIVGGLLGSGGGFILGPLLLEIGVIPQVASATATFVMMFSSSLSVFEFYILKRFPMPYALYLITVSVLAGFWGQFFVRKLVAFLGRASVIVFILSGVIFASALTMGIVGTEKSIEMIHNHEFMGFLGFCST
ncbi:putative transmembrane protein TauE [Medicago truncatula]|uniref:Putative transmembrane protein TauE n=1 Tax=Medicago truncatula TaxID=3880 RepID=A0A396JMY1_MEDTR|nr:sulfite exporter TauE/SafE family protein 4 [Medicago truncatula]RHN79650.1 putative transmembrane protein TauE [Medicago truncatula]